MKKLHMQIVVKIEKKRLRVKEMRNQSLCRAIVQTALMIEINESIAASINNKDFISISL